MAKGDKSKAEPPQNTVVVGVRIRPANQKEIDAKMQASFKPSPNGDAVEELSEGKEGQKWPYDHVFGDDCNNEVVFNTLAKPLVASALDGYNTVLFMYGQTSSGKTFTLFGAKGTRGLVDHSLQEVHKGVHEAEDQEFVIRMMFVELYNEELRDLLHDPETEGPAPKLGIVDDPVLGPLIQNITEKSFTTVEEMRGYLDAGDNRRQFGVTNMNAHSSRSHVMVRLNIESRKVAKKSSTPIRLNWGKDKPNCYSTLNLVDLAGSERANKSGTSGQSLREGSFINQSLLTLGTVISTLSKGKGGKHIPYRDSKLTRLLSSALGGNAKTCMITCISPASGNIQESYSTLRFAQRAKEIVNHAAKNELDDAHSLMLKVGKQNDEIADLRARLEGGEGKEEKSRAQRNFQRLRFLIASSTSVVKALNKEAKYDLAKQVSADVKGVLEGTDGRSLEDVIKSHKDIMDTHLATNERLTAKTRRLDRQLTRAMSADDLDENNEDEDAASIMSDMSAGLMDSFDTEELLEETARAYMYAEDLLARYTADTAALREANTTSQQGAQTLQKELTEVKDALTASQTEVQSVSTERNSLTEKLKRLVKKTGEDEAMIKEDLSKFEAQLKEMEGVIQERDKVIEGHLAANDEQKEAMAALNQANATLSQEVKEAVRMRQSFEDEAKRSKNELRGQVERLRSNMSNMLSQGDQESKVLENQNQFLFNDLRQAQDEKDALQNSHTQMTQELSYLREELTKSQEETKALIKEQQHIRNKTSHDVEKVRLQTIELNKRNTKLQLLQKEYDDFKEQTTEESAQQSDEIEKLRSTHESELKVLTDRMGVLVSEQEVLKVTLNGEQDALRAKKEEVQRFEVKSNSDMRELNKKIDDKAKELESVRNHAKESGGRSRQQAQVQVEEIGLLRRKVQELEQTLQSVEDFIGKNVSYSGDSYDEYEYGDSFEGHRGRPEDDDCSVVLSENNSYSDSCGYEEDDSVGGRAGKRGLREHSDSWQSARSYCPSSPPAVTVTPRGSPSSSLRKRSGSASSNRTVRPSAPSSSARLAALFPAETSSKAKAMMLAVRTVTASFKCLSQEQLQFCSSTQKEAVQTSEKYKSLVLDHQRISQEIEALRHLHHRSSESLDEVYHREEGLQAQVQEMGQELRDKEVSLRSAQSKEECALLRLEQVVFERDSLKTNCDNSKVLVRNLENEHRALDGLYREIESTLKEKIEEIVLLNLELDSYDQKVKVIEAERNELTSQFLGGTHRGVDENGLDTLYSGKGRRGSSLSLDTASPEPYRSPYASPYKASHNTGYNY